MPNWCEGTIKVRGKYENVVNFFKYNLDVVDALGKSVENGLSIENYNYGVMLELKNTAHIKGTHRNFTESDYIGIYHDKYDTDDTVSVCAHIKGAWAIEYEPYVELSKIYDLDIKIDGFERGMEFSQHILIEKGNLIRNETRKYKDYVWECINPMLGG